MPRITSITSQAITGVGLPPLQAIITELESYTLDNPNVFGTSSSDRFGHSVAISDSYVAVSARDEDNTGEFDTNVGITYVYRRADGVLLGGYRQGNIPNSASGNDIALSDDRLVVGCSSDGSVSGTGRVYVHDPASGTVLFIIDNPNTYVSNGDGFGWAVALSQDYIAVGAPTEDVVGTNADGAGTVNVYSAVDGTFLYTKFPDNDFRRRGSFGYSVALSADNLVIGCRTASGADNFGGGGIVYVCDPATGNTKFFIGNPNPNGTTQNDNFGHDVAVSDSFIIVGAPNEDTGASTNTGRAYVFDATDGSLLYTLSKPTTAADSDLFGHAVAISETYAIVTAYQHDDAGATDAGRSYVYHAPTGLLVATINNPNAFSTGAVDQFGYSAALLGSQFVIAATGEDDAAGGPSGKAYYYNYDLALSPRYFDLRFSSNSVVEGRGITAITYATPPQEGNVVTYEITPGDYTSTDSGTFVISATGASQTVTVLADGETSTDKIAKRFTMTLAANDSGGVSTGSLSETALMRSWILHHNIANPNQYTTSTGDQFGYAVAASGDIAIISAPFEDSSGIFVGDDGVNSGRSYVYNISSNTLLFTITSPSQYGTTSGDEWGTSVAAGGNYVAIGAPKEETPSANDVGAVNVYNTSGSQVQFFQNPDQTATGASNRFGQSIDIDKEGGDRIIIGAPGVTVGGQSLAGKVFVYSISTGALIQSWDNPSPQFGDRFGQAVAIFNNYAVIGQPYTNNFASPGEVFVFDVDTGSLLFTLTSDLQNTDFFGLQLDVSASYIAVGAPRFDSNTFSDTGRAYVYNLADGELVNVFDNPDINPLAGSDEFGSSVSLSDNYLFVGAPYEDTNSFSGVSAGRVYVFDIPSGDLLRTITNPNPLATVGDGRFGFAVSAAGDRVVIGAPAEITVSGQATSGRTMIYRLGVDYEGSWDSDANTALILDFNSSTLLSDSSLGTATVSSSGTVAQVSTIESLNIMRGGLDVSRGSITVSGNSGLIDFSNWNIQATGTTWQIEGWFRMLGQPNSDFRLIELGNGLFVVRFNDIGQPVIVANGVQSSASGASYNDGAVHYFIVKRPSNGQAILYIDGTLYTKASSDFGNPTTIDRVLFGQTDESGLSPAMTGAVIDGLRFSNTDRGYTTFDKTAYFQQASSWGLVTNGGFASEASWSSTGTTPAVFGGGVATLDSSSAICRIRQYVTNITAATYAYTFTVTAHNSTGTSYWAAFGEGFSAPSVSFSSTGTYSGVFTHSGATLAGIDIEFVCDNGAVYSVDNVAIVRRS